MNLTIGLTGCGTLPRVAVRQPCGQNLSAWPYLRGAAELNGTVTQAEFARRRGTTRQAVNQHVQSGKLDGAVTPDGRIDVEAASAILGPTARESDAELKKWKAASAKLQYEKEAGEVLHVDDVCQTVADLGSLVVEEMGQVASYTVQIGEAFQAGGEKAAKKIMDKAIREARTAIAERLRTFDPASGEED